MNPYNKKTRFVMAKSGNPLRGTLRNNRGSVVVNDDGDINAHNKREAMTQIASIMEAYKSGTIVRASSDRFESARERGVVLAEAIADKEGSSWRVLGEALGDEIWETMNREGFLRKIFMYKPIGKGEQCQLRVRIKDVIGYQVTGPSTVVPNMIRQRYVYPPEFEIPCHIWIDEKEIAQSPGDLLEDKYQDGLEQLMVVEDKVYKLAADAAASVSNVIVFFNTLTPVVFAGLRQQIMDHGIPVVSAVLASDLWNDIIADTGFSNWFEPVTKHELILEGTLGSLLGTQLHTDAFRVPNLKVLNSGEIYFNGSPETLGGILQRQEILAEPVNNYAGGRAERGWFMFEIIAIQLVNARSISKGQRL